MNFWGFLSVAVIFGCGFAGFVIYLNHQKIMKQLDIDAMRIGGEKSKTEINKW